LAKNTFSKYQSLIYHFLLGLYHKVSISKKYKRLLITQHGETLVGNAYPTGKANIETEH